MAVQHVDTVPRERSVVTTSALHGERMNRRSASLPEPGRVAARLGVSRQAIELIRGTDVIDLHLDTFIWPRVFELGGYDMLRRHGPGITRGRFRGQTDLPRLLEAGFTGGLWSITTNPLRSGADRASTFFRNLTRLRRIFDRASDRVAVVRNRSEYEAARAAGKHGAWISIQGGNALDHDLDDLARIPDDLVVRITLLHLSNSSLGVTSSPAATARGGRTAGLTDRGRDFVRCLNDRRILVDLAHISREGFFDAVEVHDPSQPLIVTHTGVTGVWKHWRNIDDDQLRAVADTGGTIGIMYQSSFLGPSTFDGKVEWIVDHLEHVVKVVGEDHASLGSDWDGSIIPPPAMPTCLEFPLVVQEMLRRGWGDERIRKVLGGNVLRVMGQIRP